MLNFFSDDWFSDTGFTIFSILPFMFVIVFAIIIFVIIASAVTMLRTKAINDAAPRLKSQAKIDYIKKNKRTWNAGRAYNHRLFHYI